MTAETHYWIRWTQ